MARLKASFKRYHVVRAIFILCAIDIVTRSLSTRQYIATRVNDRSLRGYVYSSFGIAILVKHSDIRS